MLARLREVSAMKHQRFKPSSTKIDGGCKEKHKVTVTREVGTGKWEKAGRVFDKWAPRLLLAFRLYSHAKPYLVELLAALQQST